MLRTVSIEGGCLQCGGNFSILLLALLKFKIRFSSTDVHINQTQEVPGIKSNLVTANAFWYCQLTASFWKMHYCIQKDKSQKMLGTRTLAPLVPSTRSTKNSISITTVLLADM